MTRNIIFYLFALLPVLFTGCSSDHDSPLNYDDLSGTIWEGTFKQIDAEGQTLKSYQAHIEFINKTGGQTYVIDSEGKTSDLALFSSKFYSENYMSICSYGAEYTILARDYSLIKSSSNYMAWESFGINSWILTLRKKY